MRLQKPLLLFAIILIFLFSSQKVEAVTKYWIGSSGGSFSDNANWSLSSGGANNTTAPGASDVATFDNGDVDNAAVDTQVSVAGINIISTYSGTISQSADLTVGTSNFVIAGGTYNTGSASTTVTGAFTLSGGAFTASSATTTFKGNFTRSSGTFTHNSGISVFNTTSSISITTGGSVFYNVNVICSGSPCGDTIIYDAMTVAGDLTIRNDSASNSYSIRANLNANPTITVQGNINIPSTSGTTLSIGSSGSYNFTFNLQGNFNASENLANLYANVVFTGTGDQTITKTTGNIVGQYSAWSSTKASGSLTIAATYGYADVSDRIAWTAGNITNETLTTLYSLYITGGTYTASSGTTTFKGSFSRTTGTFTHNSGIVVFDGSSSSAISLTTGNSTFYNVNMICTTGTCGDITIYDAVTIAGDLIIRNDSGSDTYAVNGPTNINPTITVQGNINVPSTSGLSLYLGSSASTITTFNLQGNLNISEDLSNFYSGLVFTGTGDQIITKTTGNIVSGYATWSSTKASGSLTIAASYGYTNSSDGISWSSGNITNETLTTLYSLYLTGGTYTAASGTTTFKGAFSRTAGTFTHNSGMVVFDGANNSAISLTPGDTTFYNVLMTCSTSTCGDITVNNNATVAGDLTVTNDSASDTYSVNGATNVNPSITVQGDINIPSTSGQALHMSGGGSLLITYNLEGNFNMSENSANFYAGLVFTGTGDQVITKTTGLIVPGYSTWSSTKASGSLTIAASYGYTNSSDGISWSSGNITNETLTTLYSLYLTGGTYTASSGTTTFKGAFSRTAGTFSHNSGMVVFDGSSNSSISLTPGSSTFNNVLMTCSTGTCGDITIYNAMTVAGDLTTRNDSVSDTYAVTGATNVYPVITVQGNLNIPSTSGLALYLGTAGSTLTTFNLQGNLNMSENLANFFSGLVFTGTGDQVITKTTGLIVPGYSTWSSTKASGNLTIAASYGYTNSSDGISWSSGNITNETLTTLYSLYLTGGTYTASSGTTTFKGSFSRTAGTFTHNSGMVVFDSSSSNNTTVTVGGSTFYNVLVTCITSTCGTTYFANNFTVAGDITFRNDSAGTYGIYGYLSANPTITVQGNMNIPSTSGPAMYIANPGSNSFSVVLHGNLSMLEDQGNLYSPITFSGTSDQTITRTAGTIASNSTWNITKTSGSAILGSTISHPSSITVATGTLDLNANNLTVTSTFSFASSTTLKLRGSETVTTPTLSRGSTVHYYGTGGPYTLKNYTYPHLIIDGSGNTFTAPATLNVNGDLTITAGTLASGGFNFNIHGNWSNSGTYTHSNNTVSFTGANQAIRGGAGTTFYNLSKATTTADTFTFPSAVTTTITNNTNLSGVDGIHLAIRSDNPGSQASVNISNSGTRTIQYIDVRDSNNTNATAVSCTTNCINSANNTNWLFTTGLTVTTQSASSITTTGATLNGTITATGGEDATQHGFAYGTSATLATTIATTTLGSYSSTGSFNESVSSLSCNTTYYFRPYATNSAGTAYGSITSFTTAYCPPTVTTQAASSVTATGAILNGNITATGGDNSTIRGFVYGLTTAYGATTTESGSFSTGSFSTTTTSLSCDTTYHVASYATNSAGTAYGSDQSFTTILCAPTGLSGVAVSPTSIQWTWTDTDTNETGFKLYSQGGALISDIATADTTTYTETGLTAATSYNRYVIAYNASDSDSSNIATAQTSAAPSGGGSSGSKPTKAKTIPPQAQNNPLISSTTVEGQSIIIAPGQDFIMKVKPENPGQLKKLTLITDDREIPFTPEEPPTSITETTLPPIQDVVYEAVVAFTEPDIYPYVIVADYASSTLITKGNFNVAYSGSSRSIPGTQSDTVKSPDSSITEKEYEILLSDPKKFLSRDTSIIKLYKFTGEIIKDPDLSLLSKILRMLGIVMGSFLIISGLIKNPLSVAEIVILPTRLMGVLMSALGIKKRYRPWGTVYDSVTKQPIDPAIVVLYDPSGNEVSTCITDLDGRYSFLVPPGVYTIKANKSNYSFPSNKLSGAFSDELYSDLYFGEEIIIKSSTDVVAKNIPMDQVNFDWNEYTKSKTKVMSFHTRWDLLIQKISSVFFISGFILSILSIIYIPEPYNFIILALYIIVSISYMLGIKPRLYGSVKDRQGKPLAFGIIRFHYSGLTDDILHRVIDQYGRYYALVPKGNYTVTIEEKNPDGGYSTVYTSKPFNAKGGIIKNKYIV